MSDLLNDLLGPVLKPNLGGPARPKLEQVPLAASLVEGCIPTIKEPKLRGGRLLWLEQRPQEQGRTTLMLREPAGSLARELTPGHWNLRSRVHGYGGGVYALANDTLVFVDDGDRCLWQLQLGGAAPSQPSRLTSPTDRAFADGLIDSQRQRWLGVMEAGGRDQLVAVPLAGGEPELLHLAADFCGYAALSPDGGQLAWVEWHQPWMPWQRSQLWLARITAAGALEDARPVAGSGAGSGEESPLASSIFQPLWISPTELVVASDATGW